ASTATTLAKITDNQKIKSQCLEVVNKYDGLLRPNIMQRTVADKSVRLVSRAANFTDKSNRLFVWNRVWEKDIKKSGNAALQGNTKDEENLVQDVSHGNHVIEYIVTAHESGNKNWGRDDV